jgi:hypothetical protein
MTETERIYKEVERLLEPITKRLERDKDDPWEQDVFASELLHRLLSFMDNMKKEQLKKCMYANDTYIQEDRKALCEGCTEEECEFNNNKDNEFEQAICKEAHRRYRDIPSTGQFGTGDYEPAEYQDEERELFTEGARWGADYQKNKIIEKAVNARIEHHYSKSSSDTKGRVIFCEDSLSNFKTDTRVRILVIGEDGD